ncbi:putative signal peptide protein [Rhodopirellula islandica]|uniref:Signal peptide protein n=1 Tax=Rhodopirellula islandica TaxID=595434 RepID=A0A0J1BMF3_RHOIS|nr:hypothetical protein [Rhodopirellula islandica]KLU07701.1 putative signal peptide protein [Rhodopirellula islandica]
MRLTHRSLCLALLCVVLPAARGLADDELFSKVAIDSVFTTASSKLTTASEKPTLTIQAEAAKVDAIEDLDELFPLAKAIDDDAVRELGAIRLVSQSDKWSLSTRMTIQGDSPKVVFEMALVTLGEASLENERAIWLSLMEVGQATPATFFGVNRESAEAGKPGQLVLRSTLSAVGLTTESLRAKLQSLSQFAVEKSPAWSQFQAEASESPVKTAAAEFSLVGQWLATPVSGEAYAMGLKATSNGSGPFQLVHVKDSKSTVSSGKYSLKEGQFSLQADTGAPLVFPLTWSDADQFELEIGAVQVNFKRQK